MAKQIATINTIRDGNTTSGNPRYLVTLLDENGCSVLQGRTKPDAQFTYSMPRDGIAEVTYHHTPSGRVIFDDISRVVLGAAEVQRVLRTV